LGFLIAVATYFAGGRVAREGLGELKDFRSSRWALVLWGALHVSAYAASCYALKEATRSSAYPAPRWNGWAFVWFAMILASASTLAVSFWPPSKVARTFWKARRGIQVGLAVGICAFVAGLMSKLLWPYLARLTLELVHALITLIASDAVAAPEELLVGTARFYVEIAPVCSGVEGIGLTLTFMGVYLYLCRTELRWPRAIALLPISVAATWLLNVVRIAGLIAIGTSGWPQVALGGFHSKAGWVFFTVVALGAVVITQRISLFRRTEQDETSKGKAGQAPENATAAYLMPMLTVLAVALLTGLVSSGFDSLYPLRVVAAVFPLWAYRRRLPRLRFSSPWLALIVGLAIGALWFWGAKGADPGAKSAIADSLRLMPSTIAVFWIGMRIVGSMLVTPIVEELAFRGFLMRRIAFRDFESVSFRHVHWIALAGSSVAFGVLHSEWRLGILAGLAYGLVTVPYGRLSDAVLAHATTNATLVACALVTRDWSILF
jgi:exosortase E/protease (VPEID-CTERM system)